MVRGNGKSPHAHETEAKIARLSRTRQSFRDGPWALGRSPPRCRYSGLDGGGAPFANVDLLDAEEGTRIRAAYSDNYGRLVALKNKYHPTNLFRLNQNIKPTN